MRLTLTWAKRSPLSATELALLQSFADQAAIAIRNARLFDRVRQQGGKDGEPVAHPSGGSGQVDHEGAAGHPAHAHRKQQTRNGQRQQMMENH